MQNITFLGTSLLFLRVFLYSTENWIRSSSPAIQHAKEKERTYRIHDHCSNITRSSIKTYWLGLSYIVFTEPMIAHILYGSLRVQQFLSCKWNLSCCFSAVVAKYHQLILTPRKPCSIFLLFQTTRIKSFLTFLGLLAVLLKKTFTM